LKQHSSRAFCSRFPLLLKATSPLSPTSENEKKKGLKIKTPFSFHPPNIGNRDIDSSRYVKGLITAAAVGFITAAAVGLITAAANRD
jgi:hypothetical protein